MALGKRCGGRLVLLASTGTFLAPMAASAIAPKTGSPTALRAVRTVAAAALVAVPRAAVMHLLPEPPTTPMTGLMTAVTTALSCLRHSLAAW